MLYRIKTIDEFDESTICRIYSLLNKKQKDYVDRKPPDKRQQSLCVRAALSEMLGDKVIPLIKSTDDGQLLKLSDGRFISFSHSGRFVAVACSDRPVGIDIQVLKPISDKIVKRICTYAESDYVQNNGLASFFDIWTMKEAFVKCFGVSFAEAKNTSFVTNGKIQIKNCETLRLSNEDYCCTILVSDKSAD